MRELMIHSVAIPYTLKPSSRAKRLIIRVQEGQVTVSIPRGVSLRKAVAFLETQRDWIYEQWQKAQNVTPQPGARVFQEGDMLPYLGTTLTLHIAAGMGNHCTIERKENILLLFVPEERLEAAESLCLSTAIYQWYKNQAREILRNKLDHFAELMGVEYRQFRLKEQKTRWGSCSTLGNINLNWRIILGPEEVVDYLVVHELAHLRHFNHSRDFWQEVELYTPSQQRLRRWLRKYGSGLRL